jgi:UDP-N-acetylmuramate: L-alanyl-gamma-D-glutamyl-meso-diaminopimelate ligase
MKIHILGICGTFMGGIALLAREAGHEVAGSDANVYPPMSTQLEQAGIGLRSGYEAAHLGDPDVVVIGNALSRGNPAVEAVLNRGLPYTSGPQWLAEQVLRDRWVLAVAGTHGKTSTSSMLARILEHAGLQPGFLVGGVPTDFGVSARLGDGTFFVVEADEYDTAFFDKRSKFVHYRPRTLVLNNLEYDHADIFPDLESIQRQFHHLVRTVPGNGLIVLNAGDAQLADTLAMGCWTPDQTVSADGFPAQWQARALVEDGSEFEVRFEGATQDRVQWGQLGDHNMHNALSAIAAARHLGVSVGQACAALSAFRGVRRRLELRGVVGGVQVYDDFAHHPTAIAATLSGLRRRPTGGRILAILEPRSNTMRLGVHQDSLPAALDQADAVWLYEPGDSDLDLSTVASLARPPARIFDSVGGIVEDVVAMAQPGDQVVVMSNGGFGGIHDKLLAGLTSRHGEAVGSGAS